MPAGVPSRDGGTAESDSGKPGGVLRISMAAGGGADPVRG